MLCSDVPREAIVGATSFVIHCATASAIGQRRVAGGEMTTRCLSGRSNASTASTSAAVHSPGPVIGLRLEYGKFGEPHSARRGRAVALRWRSLAGNNLGALTRQRYGLCLGHRTGRKDADINK